jgi:TetR/AcrR family transcriptional regulator, transcriptional repressor of bet genes
LRQHGFHANRARVDELLVTAARGAPSRQDIKRAQILEAVIQILAKKGVDELTLESVGKAVGLSRSHVVYYFKSRDELIEAAVRFSTVSAKSIIQAHIGFETDWHRALEKYVEGNFVWIGTRKEHVTVYTLLYYLASFQPAYRKLHTEIRKVGYDFIYSILESSKTIPQKRLKALTINIQGVITGNLIDCTTQTTSKIAFNQRLAQTLSAIEALLLDARQE